MNQAPEKINIAMVADWSYVIPVETTIKSIAIHNHNANIYLVNTDFPREWFTRLNQYLAPINVQIFDVKILEDEINNQYVSHVQIKPISSARLLLPRLLKSHRVIYLDSDLIIQRSLVDLYNLPLEGHPVAAAYDTFSPTIFNAGVMLMDLDALRRDSDLVDRMLKYGTHDDLNDGDQSVLNHFFFSDFLLLPDYYNLQVGIEHNWELYGILDKDNYLPTNFIDEQLIQTIKKDTKFSDLTRKMRVKFDQYRDSTIIHYVAEDKPWKPTSIARYREIWWQYYYLQWSKISNRNNLPHLGGPLAVPLFSSILYTYPVQLEAIIDRLGDLELNLTTPFQSLPELYALQSNSHFHYYPATLNYYLKKFANSCRAYLALDPTQDKKIIQTLIKRNCPIFAFSITANQELMKTYPNYHVFADNQVDAFMQTIKEVVSKTRREP